ncbi:MAG: SDR family NAD(P)-dependent oxidoreductase [Proteobacteria bacterium]|nr:SDR family NAD(P)-dependent oxidoreductase [Pseudomonadota bacterium]
MLNQNQNQNTNNPLAVVTGASSGIGYELAVQFAQAGYDLLVIAEDAAITQAAEELKALGTQVRSFQCDLARADGVDACYREIQDMHRPVSALALNAGVGVNGKFFETSLDEEINVINLNVISTVHLAKHIVRDMVERGQGGKILITSSVAATTPGPYMAIYNASKAFVQSFSEALHYELKEKGITVTALMPDATDTEFFNRAGMNDTKVGVQEKDDPAMVAKQGFEALMAGKDHVLAGSFKHRMKNAMNDLLPEQSKAKMYAGAAKPGSAAGAKETKDKQSA